jgi:hypothetical protein
MNELDYKIFKEKGILIVPESGVSSERLAIALKVELARNKIISFLCGSQRR